MRAIGMPDLGYTQGERRMILSYAITGIFGAGLALLVVFRLEEQSIFRRAFTAYEYWILASGAIGSMLALRMARDRLGRPGWRDPALGMFAASFLGAIIAGTLALPIYGTMFGPFAMVMVFLASPLTAILWFANLLAAHLMLRLWHAERDSIFGASMPTPLTELLAGILSRLNLRP